MKQTREQYIAERKAAQAERPQDFVVIEPSGKMRTETVSKHGLQDDLQSIIGGPLEAIPLENGETMYVDKNAVQRAAWPNGLASGYVAAHGGEQADRLIQGTACVVATKGTI